MGNDTYIRLVLALLFVLSLIGVLSWLVRRFRLGGAIAHSRGKARRLAVVETLALDAKRRLILVDNGTRRHLLLIGPETDLLIESGDATPDGGFGAALEAADGSEESKQGCELT